MIETCCPLDGKVKSPVLSVILPAYLEEENLRLLLPRIVSALGTLNVDAEVIVVDALTPMDATRDVADSLGVLTVARDGSNAYGDAVRTGIAKSLGEWVIFMDADGSHPPEWVLKLFAGRDSHDLVIASRYVDQGFTENSRSLVLMSRVLNWSYSVALGIRVKDVSNSFRLYRGKQLRSLTLLCDNFDIVEEILIKILRKYPDVRILEIPFTFKKRMFGDSKRNLLIFALGYLYTLLKLRFFVESGDRMLRFCVVGVAGSPVNWGVFVLCMSWFGTGANVAATLAFVVAVSQNSLLNKMWTFHTRRHLSSGVGVLWAKYSIANSLAFGVNMFVLNAVIVHLGTGRGAIIGEALGIAAGIASNLAISRTIMFHATRSETNGTLTQTK